MSPPLCDLYSPAVVKSGRGPHWLAFKSSVHVQDYCYCHVVFLWSFPGFFREMLVSNNQSYHPQLMVFSNISHNHPKIAEKRKRYLYIHVHSSIVYHSQKIESIQMFILRCMENYSALKRKKMLQYGWTLRT